MRVLVTGAAGFLGDHVCTAIGRQGMHELLITRRTETDLRSRMLTLDLMAKAKPEAVIHLAARVGGIGANQKYPATFWRENLEMGMNVLEACSLAKVKKLVMVGTTCSYPRAPRIPFREADLFDGYPEDTNAPYGIAKRALIVGAEAYRKEFGLNAVTVIPTNLYGPWDNFDPESSHVIPAMIRKYHEAMVRDDDIVELWGTGSPTRDFLYVEDAAMAIVEALEKLDGPAPVNLGSGHEVSIREISQQIARMVGYRGVTKWDASQPDGQPRRCLDTSRAADLLGWRSTTTLHEGLRKTYDWWLK